MSLIRLLFKNVAEIVASKEVGLIVLANEDRSRQLSIVCDKAMLYQFGLRMSNAEVKEKLLPEVLWQVVKRNLDMQFQIIINDLIEGQYKTLLYMPDILQAIPIRASDAILLAHFAQLPIFIEENLFLRQSVPFTEGAVGVSVPVNVISNEMLKKALDKAVDEEDYEQASQLRDELLRRGGKDVTL